MRVFFICVVACLCFSVPLSAAPKKKLSKTEQKTYIETWAKANENYKLQEYQPALDGYKEAYRISSDADILLNMGRCYQKMKKYDDALSSYRLYLKEEPSSPYKTEIETEVIAKLEELKKQGAIKISSDQEGTEVVFDGTKQGVAPLEVKEVQPGEHIIELTKEGFEPNTQKVTLNPNQALVVEIVMVPLPGTIEISADQEGAEVFLDGVSQGASVKTLRVDAGEHRIGLLKPKFKLYEQTLVVGRGEKVSIQAKLEIATGSLQVFSNVKSAAVFLNGQNVGMCSPEGVLMLSGIPVGEHEIMVTQKSFKDAKQTLELVEDKVLPVEVVLSGSAWPKATYILAGASGATSGVFAVRGFLLWKSALEAYNEGVFQTKEQSDTAQEKFNKSVSTLRISDSFLGVAVISVGVGLVLHHREEKQKINKELAKQQPVVQK